MGKGSRSFGLKSGRILFALAFCVFLCHPAHARPVRAGVIPPVGSLIPTITSINPSSVLVGNPSFQLVVKGAHFGVGAKVHWNGAVLATVRKSSDTLTATVPAGYVVAAGMVNVTVSERTVVSHALTFKVANPQPVLTSVSPASFYVWQGDATLALMGSGFIPGSTVYWNGAALSTTYLSPTSLSAVAPAALFSNTSPITADVTVGNPAPGGGSSAGMHVHDQYGVATLSGSYLTIAAQAGDQQLRVRAAGLGPGPIAADAGVTIDWNGHPLPAHTGTLLFAYSIMDLYVTVPASYLQAEGIAQVTVTDASGTSNEIPVYMISPTLSLTSAGPEVMSGSEAFTLTVNGTGFEPAKTLILWNGVARSVTYISPTELQLQVSATDVATAGTVTLQAKVVSGPHNIVRRYSNTLDYTIRGATITTVNQPTGPLVWDATHQVIYTTTSNYSVTHQPALLKLDPVSAQITASIPVEKTADLLAISEDGQYLYVGARVATMYNQATSDFDAVSPSFVRRYALPGLVSGTDWQVSTVDPYAYQPTMMAVRPGAAGTIAVLWTKQYIHAGSGSVEELGTAVVYDDGVARSSTADVHERVTGAGEGNLAWGSGNTLYLGDSDNSYRRFMVMDAGASGLAQIKSSLYVSPSFMVKQGFHFDVETSHVFTDSGAVIDPVAGTVLSQLSMPDSTGTELALKLVLDDAAQRVYMLYLLLDPVAYQYRGMKIVSYDLTTLAALDTFLIPNAASPGNPSMIRWGTHGLAVADNQKVYMIQGDFVH